MRDDSRTLVDRHGEKLAAVLLRMEAISLAAGTSPPSVPSFLPYFSLAASGPVQARLAGPQDPLTRLGEPLPGLLQTNCCHFAG